MSKITIATKLNPNKPITVREKGSVLYLYLNTPNTNVNVFTRTIAQQIHEIFDQVDSDKTRLIVFRSTKPYSFLNGAELILTQSMKTLDDVFTLTNQTKAAYEKVAFSKVPTVAAIEGNCFGCGVEFVLCCDYRIASDSYDTRFYMTELRDYFLLPLFGSLEKLPKLVGLHSAADLLIKGDVWNAKQALRGGLVDAVLSHESIEHDLDKYIEFLSPKKRNLSLATAKGSNGIFSSPMLTPAEANKLRNEMNHWISALPPEQHALHQKCLEILFKSTTTRKNPQITRQKKAKLSPQKTTKSKEAASSNLLTTLSTEASRQATSFFFVRTMSRVANLGTSAVAPSTPVEVILSHSHKNSAFGKILQERTIRDLRVAIELPTLPSSTEQITIRTGKNPTGISFQVQWGYKADLSSKTTPILYFPCKDRVDYCEAILHGKPDSATTEFLLALSQLGWQTLVTYPSQTGSSTSTLNRYFELFKNEFEREQTKGTFNRLQIAMRNFGYEVLMPTLYQRFFNVTSAISELKSNSVQKSKMDEDTTLVTQFLIPFYELALKDLQEKRIRNRAVVDLIMRSVFEFPLSKGSFTETMEKRRDQSEKGSDHHRSGQRNRIGNSTEAA